jgi:hypothetical protein
MRKIGRVDGGRPEAGDDLSGKTSGRIKFKIRKTDARKMRDAEIKSTQERGCRS